MTDWEKSLEIIASYLKRYENSPKVIYLCKGQGAEYCHHTTHIDQARNFEKIGPNKWMEKEPKLGEWIPLEYDDEEKVTHTSFPYELDGNWVLVTDGKVISIERIKKDIPDDHFSPAGRWFELKDVVAWMPLPDPPKGGDS